MFKLNYLKKNKLSILIAILLLLLILVEARGQGDFDIFLQASKDLFAKKNIYQIQGGYQLQQEDFRFNILYTDPSPLNYISQVGTTPLPVDNPATPNIDEGVAETPLLKVF